MVVRNEAAVIARCLDGALPHVDGFVICDTGSIDETIAIIHERAAQHGTPGVVCQHAWRDFGHNRTAAADETRAWVASQGWPLDATYMLLLDADMVLHVDAAFDRETLSATSYLVLQDNRQLRYWNIRLACLSHAWRAVGVTHEYWQPIGDNARSERLNTMTIEDRADGGCKSDKFVRDIRLLSAALRREPNNTRYMFYLAQSYFDAGRWVAAERLYARRYACGGWDEEGWYARYRQGWSLLRLGDRDRAVGVLLGAFDERPSRAEPLWLMARHYRDRRQYHAALMVALRGLDVPYPESDSLFVDTHVYNWMLLEEVMISAFYAGPRYHDAGLAACERLLARRDHEPWFYGYVARNELFYLRAATGLTRGRVEERGHDGARGAGAAVSNRCGSATPHALAAVSDAGGTVPWPRCGEPRVIAGYDPFLVHRVDPETGRIGDTASRVPELRATAFRASTGSIPVAAHPGTFIALVHEIVQRDSGDVQWHRWIEITDEGVLRRYSRPFFFDGLGDERATGLSTTDDGVLVTYESMDRVAQWMTFDWPTVLRSLEVTDASP